jgi:glycosyltransferase involved in cell wall biosynthesis
VDESNSNARPRPRVSVLILTYNQRKYISEAIESALMQKTSFNYEVLIGEDSSTDGTAATVHDYAARYPTNIRALFRSTNIGAAANFRQTLSSCRGEFVALLEGDDYWTSSEKLQKQVDFLDQYSDCAMCFHNAKIIYQDDDRPSVLYNSPDQKTVSTFEDLWQYNFIASCTALFRTAAITCLPDWLSTLPFGDWPLFMLCAQHGNIGYLDEVLAVYRIHKEGLWSKLDSIQKLESRITFYENMNAHLGFRYTETAQPIIARYKDELAIARRTKDLVTTILPPNAIVLVLSKAGDSLPRFDTRLVWAFPDRIARTKPQLFASAASGSVEAPWIDRHGAYDFRLYGGPRQETLLASVAVTQRDDEQSSGRAAEKAVENRPYITATPNPVPRTANLGKTFIEWSTGDGSLGSIYVSPRDQPVLYPTDSSAAIEELERFRARGAEFLVAPRSAFDLFDRYPELKRHLHAHYRLLVSDENICLAYDLRKQIRHATPDMAAG